MSTTTTTTTTTTTRDRGDRYGPWNGPNHAWRNAWRRDLASRRRNVIGGNNFASSIFRSLHKHDAATSITHAWVGQSVASVTLCEFVRALEKRPELSTPNLVDIQCMAVVRHAPILGLNGQRSRSRDLHGYAGRYDCLGFYNFYNICNKTLRAISWAGHMLITRDVMRDVEISPCSRRRDVIGGSVKTV